jgi:hypothetical protein
MTPTPLPDLEAQLVDAARRMERAAAPRRRWWRHGWAVMSVVLVTAGAGVAVARVAHLGPFSYLDRFGASNPKLAAASVIDVEPAGPEPAWKAVALINKIGQVCITGGPRDPRTNPSARPTEKNLNNPPAAGLTCADSDEIAQTLVDPDWPGATFAGSTALDGSPDVNQGRMDSKGRFVPLSRDYPTRALVYAIAPKGLTPVVRWGASGTPTPMVPSAEHLRLRVDKSPEGLSSAEYRLVSTYPDEIDIVLWAAPTDYPRGVTQAQVAFPAELAPHGVDDATVEMISVDDLMRLDREGRASGWKYQRGIRRDPVPVKREAAAQRAKIAAFARPRTAADDVPAKYRPKFYSEFQRVQYAASRRLSIAGGGVPRAWLAPGGLTPDREFGDQPGDLTCPLGPRILGDCKHGAVNWKHPLVEAVSCSRAFQPGESFVWALSPPGATRIELVHGGRPAERLAAAELVALRRDRAAQPTAIRWVIPDGKTTTVRVPWPKTGAARCGSKPPAWSSLRRDSVGGTSSSGGPRAPRLP